VGEYDTDDGCVWGVVDEGRRVLGRQREGGGR
jgi:hypothetical protein